MKLLIDIPELDDEQLEQLQKSAAHHRYNHHVELKWLWPAWPTNQARAMTDVVSVASIEKYEK